MPGRTGWVAAAIVAVVVGAGVAAVTSDSDSPGPLKSAGGDKSGSEVGDKVDDVTLIASSAEAASDAGTAKFTFAMDIGGGAEGSMTMHGDGEVQFEPPAVHMQLELPGVGDGNIEAVLSGTTMYMKVPGGLGAQAPPTPWISMDLERLAGEGALGQLGTSGGNDPSQMLDFLRGVSNDVQTVGQDVVRGVTATHYRADVDIRKAIAEAPGDEREAIEQAFRQYEAMGASTVFPIDVWIDDEGLPRKLTMDMDLSGIPDAPPGAGITITMEMFDYGADVSIVPPPPDQVTDMTEAAGSTG